MITGLGDLFTTVIGVFGTIWTFITGNWLMMAMVATPFVFGVVYAFFGLFRRGE